MAQASLANRLHHTAYVTKDMEATRHFYEDILGIPLVATWCEKDILFGKERTYMHCFFGLKDNSALAFFQFANPEDQEEFGPSMPPTPFHHIALHVDAETQQKLEERIAKAGYKEPDTYVLEHGYCRSVYVVDPNGMIVEFVLDLPEAMDRSEEWKERAHSELKRWLEGDHKNNNEYR